MEIYLWVIGIILVLIAIVLLLFVTIVSDGKLILWFLLDKKNLKYRLVRAFEKNNQTIYVVGSIHWWHLKGDFYQLKELREIYNKINPELVMVEARPEQLESDNYADGPIEMLYIILNSIKDGFSVKGIDYFEECGKSNTTTDLRDNIMVDRIINESQGKNTTIVFEGASHCLIQTKLFKERGYKRKRISKSQIVKLFSGDRFTNEFPEESIYYLEKKIEIIKKLEGRGETEEERAKWKERFIREINAYIDLINGIDVFARMKEEKKNRKRKKN